MKFSKCLPLAALASLATAVPTSFTVSVNADDENLLNSIHKSDDACTKACLPEKIDCGECSVRVARWVIPLDTNYFTLTSHKFFLVRLGGKYRFYPLCSYITTVKSLGHSLEYRAAGTAVLAPLVPIDRRKM